MRCMKRSSALAATVALLLPRVAAIDINPDDVSSIKRAASEVAAGMLTWYTDAPSSGEVITGIPGLLPYPPYYWWEAGAMMGSLIDYWYYTGDAKYNSLVTNALEFQSSPTLDYMPANQTRDEGNDDQVFWGFQVMSAAEYRFPNPPSDKPQWLALAQGVWNSQQRRWEDNTCGGGLRWQIFTWNNGWDYKNAPSNAGFINMGARLYAYTGNQTYADWTEKAWEWMTDVGLIGTQDGGPGYNVYDGTNVPNNCSNVSNHQRWSYSYGMLLQAAAVMWNVTGESIWETRALGIWEASKIFVHSGDIIYEQECERAGGNCDQNDLAFKGFFIRFMAASAKVMSQLLEQFQPIWRASALAAGQACTGTAGGLTGNACGFNWISGKFDGTYGVGQQMDAMQAFMANMIQDAAYPVTARTGGISKGDPNAGTTATTLVDLSPITTASRAGAGILTAFVLGAWLTGTWWVCI